MKSCVVNVTLFRVLPRNARYLTWDDRCGDAKSVGQRISIFWFPDMGLVLCTFGLYSHCMIISLRFYGQLSRVCSIQCTSPNLFCTCMYFTDIYRKCIAIFASNSSWQVRNHRLGSVWCLIAVKWRELHMLPRMCDYSYTWLHVCDNKHM